MPKKTAIKLIKNCNSNDPFEIAKQRGIIVLHEPLGSVLGYYNSYKRIQFIHINNSIPKGLEKFVCAHELGHAMLHRGANTPFLKKNTFFSIDKIELEANTFAVELLMPDEAIYEHKYSALSLSEIAGIYGVPKEVTHLKSLQKIQ